MNIVLRASLLLWLSGVCSDALAATCDVAAVDLARCAALTATSERLACYDALASRAPVDANQNFGIAKPRAPTLPKQSLSVEAHVTRVSIGRLGRKVVVLDNGQTWVATEDDTRVETGDAVTIRRAALGTFLMTTPSRRSYRVQRTQ